MGFRFYYCFIFLFALFFQIQNSRANEEEVIWDQKKYISNSLNIILTKKGQSYFKNNLSDFLLRNGIIIDRSIIDKKDPFFAKLPFLLSQLPEEYKKFQPILDKTIHALQNFYGISLNEPKFKISVDRIQYKANISKLGVSILPDDTFQMSGEINHIVAQALQFKLRELNNKTLGIGVGSSKAEFIMNQSSSEKEKIKFSMNLKLNSDSNQRFNIDVQPFHLIENTLNQSLTLGTPLLLPKMSTTIQDPFTDEKYIHSFNTQKLEIELLKLIPSLTNTLVKLGVESLKEFLPKKLESTLEETLNSSHTNVSKMEAPGGPTEQKDSEKFIWNVVPTAITTKQSENAFISMKAIIEDPQHKVPNEPYYSKTNALPYNKAELDEISKHDLAIDLNQNFVNRLLHLSFERGYFDDIMVGKDESSRVKLLAPPILNVNGPYGSNYVKASLYIEQEISSFVEKRFIRSPIRLHVDAYIKLVPSARGGVKVLFSQMDLNSVKIDPDRIKMFPNIVHNKTVNKLAEINESMKTSPAVLVEHIALPDSIFGVPLKLTQFKTTRLHSILLFVRYDL